jgi:uncharacterized protein (TIGR02099 family)
MFSIRRLTTIIISALVIFAIVITVVRVLLHQISQDPAFIAQQISKSLDRKVTITNISARLNRLTPELALENLTISDQTGNQIFSLQQASVRLYLFPLITMGKIKASLITVDQAAFNLRQTQSGQIIVDGFDEGDSFLASIIENGHYHLRNSHIRWLDQNSDNPIDLNQVDFILDTTDNSYRLNANAAVGKQGHLQLIANLSENAINHAYAGTVFAKSTAVQLANFKHLLPANLPIKESLGNFNLWGEIHNSALTTLNGQLSANQILWNTSEQPSIQTTDLPDYFSAKIWMQAKEKEWKIATDQLDLGHWLPSDLQLSIQSKSSNTTDTVPTYTIAASALQLEKIIPLITTLSTIIPATNEITAQLSKMSVQGHIKNLRLSYQPDNQHRLWSACGDFSQLQINYPKYVDLQGNWTGQLCVNQDQAALTLNTGQATIKLADLYLTPIKLTAVNGQLNWKNTSYGWQLATDQLELTTSDLDINLNLDLQAHLNNPWVLDTTVDFELSHAENLKHYLPSKILAADVDEWLSRVFVDGSLHEGQFTYHGQLVDSPFSSRAAVSTANVKLHNTRIQFDPQQEWPQLSHFNADLHFKNGLATMNVEQGSSLGVSIRNGTITIKDVSDLANVQIRTHLETSLELAENYVRNSPLEQMIGSIIHYIGPSGDSSFNLDFLIPLHSDTDKFWIIGDVELDDASIELADLEIHASQVTGQLQFTEETVSAEAIQAVIDNQPAQIDIKDSPKKTIVIAKTRVNDHFLHQRWPWLKPLHGNTNVSVNVEIAKDSPTQSSDVLVKIHSNLQDMSVNLPAPLQKTAKQSKNLAISINLNDSNLVPIEVHYGINTHADLKLLKLSTDQWNLDSAHLMIGNGSLPTPDDAKLSLQVQLPEWNLDELQSLATLSSVFNNKQSKTNNHSSIDTANINLLFNIDKLEWGNTTLGSMVLSLARQKSNWQGKIDGSIATGTIDYQPSRKLITDIERESRGKLSIQLTTLTVPNTANLPSAENSTPTSQTHSYSPKQLPDFNISVQELIWDGINLGHLLLDTSTIANGLSINQLTLKNTEHQLSTNGHWYSDKGMMYTALKGDLQSQNMAQLLQNFGIYDDIRKTAAAINFDLNWQASPFNLNWQSLNGTVDFNLDHGHLLGVEPGIGRALGLFSLNAWQRRLRLDFSDVVDEGFAYENVSAKFDIIYGNAYSSNLEIDGVAARVNLAGRIGFFAKDIDAVATVIPRSSIALPLVGAAGGPIGIGAGFVIQQVVGDQFETLSSSEYTITGEWTNPQVALVPENGGIFTRMLWEIQKLTGLQQSVSQ